LSADPAGDRGEPPTPVSAMAMPIGTRTSIIRNIAAKPGR
jgi:hypothetical protein